MKRKRWKFLWKWKHGIVTKSFKSPSENENAKPFECTLCGRTIPMTNHVERDHGPISVECDACGKCSQNKISWKTTFKLSMEKIRETQQKEKLTNVKNGSFQLKSKVSAKLSQFKEIEFEEKKICSCVGDYHIRHHKHNWAGKRSETFLLKIN